MPWPPPNVRASGSSRRIKDPVRFRDLVVEPLPEDRPDPGTAMRGWIEANMALGRSDAETASRALRQLAGRLAEVPAPERPTVAAALQKALTGCDTIAPRRLRPEADAGAALARLAAAHAAAGRAHLACAVLRLAAQVDPVGQSEALANAAGRAAVVEHERRRARAAEARNGAWLQQWFGPPESPSPDVEPWLMADGELSCPRLEQGQRHVLLARQPAPALGSMSVAFRLPQPSVGAGLVLGHRSTTDYLTCSVTHLEGNLWLGIYGRQGEQWIYHARQVIPLLADPATTWFELQVDYAADAVVARCAGMEVRLHRNDVRVQGAIGLVAVNRSEQEARVSFRSFVPPE